MKHLIKSISLKHIALIGVLALVGFVATYVTAWVGPTTAAPGGNVAAPINTGNISQTKGTGSNDINFTMMGGLLASTEVVGLKGMRAIGPVAGDGYVVAQKYCIAPNANQALFYTPQNPGQVTCIDSWSDLCVGQNNTIVLCGSVPPVVGLTSPQVITQTQNFTAPVTGTYTFEVYGAGGGGSGGGRGARGTGYGAQNNVTLSLGGTGGAGGQAGEKKTQTVTLAAGATVAIQIGTGGTGGAGGTSQTIGTTPSCQDINGVDVACGEVTISAGGSNGAAGSSTSISGPGISVTSAGGAAGTNTGTTFNNSGVNCQGYTTTNNSATIRNGIALGLFCTPSSVAPHTSGGYSYKSYLASISGTTYSGATAPINGFFGTASIGGNGGRGGKAASITTAGVGITQATPANTVAGALLSSPGTPGAQGTYANGGSGGAGSGPTGSNGGAGGKGGDGFVVVSWI